MNELANKIETEIARAIRDHGILSFTDRPGETLNVVFLVQECRKAGVADTYEAFKFLMEEFPQRNEGSISTILVQLQDWDELWDSYEDLGDWM